jgi:Thermophilic glucose-6-phosphate isomerase and related metalloenzymes
MVKKTSYDVKENVRDGKGKIEFHHVLQAEELNGHGTMYAKVIMEPHSSIGRHQHVGCTEPYYILSGKAIFEDNDGTKTVVEAGDVCIIECGESHAIENPYDEPMEMMALIYNE